VCHLTVNWCNSAVDPAVTGRFRVRTGAGQTHLFTMTRDNMQLTMKHWPTIVPATCRLWPDVLPGLLQQRLVQQEAWCKGQNVCSTRSKMHKSPTIYMSAVRLQV
jgi:hypothetical protein